MTVQSSSPQPNQQPAGWYDVGQGWARYWDGQSWSEAITHEALSAQQAAQQAAPAAPSYQQQPPASAQQGYQDPNAGYQQPGYQAPNTGYQQPGPQGYQDPNAGYQQPGPQAGYQDPNAGYQPPGPQAGYQDPNAGYQPPGPPGYQQPGLQGLQQNLQGALAGLQVPDLAAKGPGGLPVILFPAIIAGSALLVMLGSLLPWASVDTAFGSISVRGTEGDGVLTILLALAGGAAAVAVVMARKPMAAIGGIVAGGLALLIGAYDFLDLARATGDSSGLVEAHVGFGLWLVLLGSLAMTGASIAILVLQKQQPKSQTSPSAW